MRSQREHIDELLARNQDERSWRERLSSALPVPVLVTDTAGVVVDANAAGAFLLGVDPRHLVGKPLLVYVEASDRVHVREALNRLAVDGRGGARDRDPRAAPTQPAEGVGGRVRRERTDDDGAAGAVGADARGDDVVVRPARAGPRHRGGVRRAVPAAGHGGRRHAGAPGPGRHPRAATPCRPPTRSASAWVILLDPELIGTESAFAAVGRRRADARRRRAVRAGVARAADGESPTTSPPTRAGRGLHAPAAETGVRAVLAVPVHGARRRPGRRPQPLRGAGRAPSTRSRSRSPSCCRWPSVRSSRTPARGRRCAS